MARAGVVEIVQFHWRSAFEHPPLWVLLMHFWSMIWGQSEFALRLPAAFAGVLLVPLMWQNLKLCWPTRSSRSVCRCAVHRELPCADPLQPRSADVRHRHIACCDFRLSVPTTPGVGQVGLVGGVRHHQCRHARRPLLLCLTHRCRGALPFAHVAIEATETCQADRRARALDPTADPVDLVVPRLPDHASLRDVTAAARWRLVAGLGRSPVA